ncbi:MAG TPA: ATP-binding protein [Steroidobacteraceae bacterium]|jgi:two-component system sensor histidine kinase PilS (NtrC family)|nr:ATP-binding protein [Steroidobacteraceae bacterium]
MPALSASAPVARRDLAWRVIGLVNLYRLLLPPVLLTIQWLAGQEPFSPTHRGPFLSACIAYFSAGVLLVVARRLSWPSLRGVALLNTGVDAAAISLILYASGGVASGLGILLVLPVVAMAVLAEHRDAFLIAAMAALGILLQQVFVYVAGAAPAGDFITGGVIGVVLFAIALSAWPIAHRLRESEALVRRQEIDLANLAQLSQYIVQHLRESILVVDTEDRVRLINESAAQMLGDRSAYPGALLGEASPRLLYLLETWRQRAGAVATAPQTFTAADGARVIEPHFAPLGASEPAPILVFLEDTSLITEKVQQSKLAALGRLSASIAHEIRNPVGAMSHAGQLLAESPNLAAEDQRLTEIICANSARVSDIINNVLRLSRREATQLERLSLGAWIEDFRDEFCATMQCPPERLTISGGEAQIEVRVDSSQLHQVVWNLCDNVLRHAPPEVPIEIRYGRISSGSRPYLEVADRGPGVEVQHIERIFEPFFSGGHGGSGLGLFLAKELAQTNGATLLYEPRPGGGSIFRMVFADPHRWSYS